MSAFSVSQLQCSVLKSLYQVKLLLICLLQGCFPWKYYLISPKRDWDVSVLTQEISIPTLTKKVLWRNVSSVISQTFCFILPVFFQFILQMAFFNCFSFQEPFVIWWHFLRFTMRCPRLWLHEDINQYGGWRSADWRSWCWGFCIHTRCSSKIFLHNKFSLVSWINVYIPDMVCSHPKRQVLVQIPMVYTWKWNSSSILSVEKSFK